MLRALSTSAPTPVVPFDLVVLTHEERHIRRKVIKLQHGDDILVDLPRATAIADRERLVLEDGRHVEVIAAEEPLIEIRARSPQHLLEIAWHIGNRHLAAQLECDRILIARDHVIADMLKGLGAHLRDVLEPFEPARGAYDRLASANGGHGHHHHHEHDGRRDHSHGHDHT